MCRIAGIVDFNNSLGQELEPIIVKMRDSMAHGGPDGAGIFISNDRKVALGNRRLAILDTSPLGHQPMYNKDKSIWITFNGEIFNFKETRNELRQIGYSFNSESDTEVLLYGYEEWGIDKLLPKLHGMFAFAIYDSRTPDYKLLLVRDRLGVKPLYYYQDKERFIFASEVRGIMNSGLVQNKENREALVRFLRLGSIPHPLTTIEGIYSVPAGHYMLISNEKKQMKKYWEISDYFLDTYKRSSSYNTEEIIENSKRLFTESIRLRLVSDVPVGVFLSGGIDSSSIVALSSNLREQKITTVSINFQEPSFSEAKYQRIVANRYNTDHNEVLLTSKDFLDELPKIFSSMDQPTVDGINTYFVSKIAKKLGLKVVLSGIGGDEVFLGYKHFKQAYFINSFLQFYSKVSEKYRKKLTKLFVQFGNSIGVAGKDKFEYLANPSSDNAYLLYRGLFTPLQIQKILGITELEFKAYEPAFEFLEWREDSLFKSLTHYFNYMDFYHYLNDQILKDTDFMSMAHGVEIRVPFLDHKLVEYVASIDPSLRLKGGRNKFLLSKIADTLPKEVLYRKKMGFVFPFANWLRKEWAEADMQHIEKNACDKKFLSELWNGFKQGNVHWSRIWALSVYSNFTNN